MRGDGGRGGGSAHVKQLDGLIAHKASVVLPNEKRAKSLHNFPLEDSLINFPVRNFHYLRRKFAFPARKRF